MYNPREGLKWHMIPREYKTGYPVLTQGGEESEEVSIRKGYQRINQVKMKNKKSIPGTGTNTCKGPEVGGKQKGGKDLWSTVRLENREWLDHTGPERSCPGLSFTPGLSGRHQRV